MAGWKIGLVVGLVVGVSLILGLILGLMWKRRRCFWGREDGGKYAIKVRCLHGGEGNMRARHGTGGGALGGRNVRDKGAAKFYAFVFTMNGHVS